MQCLAGGAPVQHLARAAVQESLDMLDLTTRDPRELRALRVELPDEAVRILVRAPLPGTMVMDR